MTVMREHVGAINSRLLHSLVLKWTLAAPLLNRFVLVKCSWFFTTVFRRERCVKKRQVCGSETAYVYDGRKCMKMIMGTQNLMQLFQNHNANPLET